jgi:hypothetical protein
MNFADGSNPPMDAQTALANLEATAFNLLLVANNIGAKLGDEPLGRVLCAEAGLALTALFEWRRLRWERVICADRHHGVSRGRPCV